MSSTWLMREDAAPVKVSQDEEAGDKRQRRWPGTPEASQSSIESFVLEPEIRNEPRAKTKRGARCRLPVSSFRLADSSPNPKAEGETIRG